MKLLSTFMFSILIAVLWILTPIASRASPGIWDADEATQIVATNCVVCMLESAEKTDSDQYLAVKASEPRLQSGSSQFIGAAVTRSEIGRAAPGIFVQIVFPYSSLGRSFDLAEMGRAAPGDISKV